MGVDKHEVDRRQFLKWMGLAAAGGVAAVAGIKPKPDNSPKETPTADAPEYNNGISQSEEEKDNYWSGEVEEGEGLTLTVERISGRKMDNLSGFKLIWEHDGVNYIFESKKAFMNQDAVPLPVVWPKDKVILGSESQMEEDMSRLKELPIQQKVYLEGRNRTDTKDVEQVLSVFGGRFDRTVYFKFNKETDSWQVNPVKDEWVDSDRFKDIMENNPDMKSSEAFEQL